MDKVINNNDILQSTIDNPTPEGDVVTASRDPLSLTLDNSVFVERAGQLIKDSKKFFDDKYNLTERRKRNEKYLFGRQLQDTKFKKYQLPFSDNIIWESESYIKPMALSRLPDVVVTPGSETEAAYASAEDLSRMVTTDISSRERKRVLGLAFKHIPVHLVGAIKPFWNPQKGKNGDYDFRVVNPENLVLDWTTPTNDAKDMDFVAENIEYTVKEWIMRFPDKKADFIKELYATGHFNDSFNEKSDEGMNSKVKGWEFWFTHFEPIKADEPTDATKEGEQTEAEQGEDETPDVSKGVKDYERQECVAWFYNKLVFKKMKSPNWDWEGEKQVFHFEEKADEEELRKALFDLALNGNEKAMDGFATKKIFHNYLKYPEKPYILLGYEQWGKTPIDETSRIEQVIMLQDSVDKRGRQITEMLDRARGKHVFSSKGGIKKETYEEMDLNDPDEDILVDDDPNKVHAFIPGEQPSAQMIQNLNETRDRIFSKMGVHGPARGAVDTGTPATNNQISREGDFTRIDDVVDDTINYAAEKMARWILQFIRLRYTEDHFVRVLGEDGKTLFRKINRDLVDDGMEVQIGSSGTDKLKAEQRAMDMAKLNRIDPLTFYTDLGVSDPKGRAEKLALFESDPAAYIRRYVNPSFGGPGMAQAQRDVQIMKQGKIPPLPPMVDKEYMEVLTNFINSVEFENLLYQLPEFKEPALEFAQKVSGIAEATAQAEAQNATKMPPSNGAAVDGGKVGPLAQNPSPENTARVAAVPPVQ